MSRTTTNPTKAPVPLWEKYALTVEEAAALFGIGENRLRSIIKEQSDAEFLLAIGSKTLFKRELFVAYLDKTSTL